MLQERARLELARRIAVLGTDVTTWTAVGRTDAMCLSRSQRLAVVNMMGTIDHRQRTSFQAIDQDLPPGQFSDGNAALLVELTGSHELWQVFRGMLGQLEDPGLQRAARAASRIAADCYAVGIRQARSLEVIKPDRLREAPLVYLEATESPATAGREERAQLLDASIRQWRNLKLPLPIVLLPVDGTRSISNYCAIHHEVGHNLDQDLDLLPELRGALPDLFPQPDAEKQWRRWSAEILADALGVVLGGVGFALSLGMLALSLFPAARYQEPDADAEHPPLALRVRLLVEMLRHSGVPEQAPVAGQLQAVWEPLPRPAWVEPFVAGAAAVATLFLTRKLDKLKQHSILELNPKAGRDHQQIEALASWLLTGTNRPVAELTQGMSPRIVPSAAQWAIWRAETMDAAELERIQSEAWKYLDVIPPDPVPLAGGLAADRRTYLDSLVTSVDFGKLKRREVP